MPTCAGRGLLQASAWRSRGRTLKAMALLCAARLLVALAPLRWWRGTLGQVAALGVHEADALRLKDAVRLASHVERAAERMPFQTKCLPRAMALAWLLRDAGVPYRLKIATRPAHARSGDDSLHAWVECGPAIVLGELPGPWVELLALTAPAA